MRGTSGRVCGRFDRLVRREVVVWLCLAVPCSFCSTRFCVVSRRLIRGEISEIRAQRAPAPYIGINPVFKTFNRVHRQPQPMAPCVPTRSRLFLLVGRANDGCDGWGMSGVDRRGADGDLGIENGARRTFMRVPRLGRRCACRMLVGLVRIGRKGKTLGMTKFQWTR